MKKQANVSLGQEKLSVEVDTEMACFWDYQAGFQDCAK